MNTKMTDIIELMNRIAHLENENTRLSEENDHLIGICSLQGEELKQMSKQIESYREIVRGDKK